MTTNDATDTKLPYRPWWPVAMMASTAALLFIVSMAFTMVTSVQRADRAEHRAEASNAQDDCYALYGAAITDTTQAARSALNDLVVIIARAALNQEPPEVVRPRYEAAIATLERTNLIAEASIAARTQYLADGFPLPCPINP